ncbi:MAG: Ppx/GppA family phosphatase [Alphaproteobacteria bacterium]|nr:MAG: Ppx/GppA family phosphatase [Alphaproteobacteria bacterium]
MTAQEKEQKRSFSRHGRPHRNGVAAGKGAHNGQLFGALDLGTNNCRLLVAKPEGRSFRVVDAFSRIVRLGEGLTASGRLSDAAVERTIAALKVCARKMQDRGVTRMRNVATEACRQADNCEEFVSRVRAETGLDLDIIPPAEEARLAVMGCQALFDPRYRRAIVFDIGGGSTELIWTAIERDRRPRILGWTSVPYGVVNLSEIYSARDALSPEVYCEMVAIVRARLEAFDKRFNLAPAVRKGRVQMLGTSGTVTTLTSLHLKLPRYDRSRVDGAWMRTSDLRDLSARLSAMNYDERANFGCMGADRAELVVAGCAILDAIFDLWPVERIRVADRGIREGMLLDLMGAQAPRRRSGFPGRRPGPRRSGAGRSEGGRHDPA